MPFKIAPTNRTLFENATIFFAKVEIFNPFLLSSFFSILDYLFVFGSI